jgi:hypothetical protein
MESSRKERKQYEMNMALIPTLQYPVSSLHFTETKHVALQKLHFTWVMCMN